MSFAQISDNSVQIIETEEDQRGYALKATFDGELLKKIKGLQLNLKTGDNIFNKMQRMFARSKISYNYKTFEGNNYSCIDMADLPIQLDTIRITVPCYVTNHEGNHNLILGNLFLNSLDDYSIGKNGIEINYNSLYFEILRGHS